MLVGFMMIISGKSIWKRESLEYWIGLGFVSAQFRTWVAKIMHLNVV